MNTEKRTNKCIGDNRSEPNCERNKYITVYVGAHETGTIDNMANKVLSSVTDHLYLLLFCVSAGSIVPRGSLNKTIIRFGYLMQESAPPYRVGAINLAIRNAQSDGFLQGYSFRFENYIWLNLKCNSLCADIFDMVSCARLWLKGCRMKTCKKTLVMLYLN